MGQRDGFVGANRASSSNGAAYGEVVFPRCYQAEFGQPADFRRKGPSLDAEVVRELLAVEGDVEFDCSFLLCYRAQICHQPISSGTVRQYFDLAVKFYRLDGNRAHGADKSLFYYGDWIKESGVAIVSCNDGLRPVVMKLEATDKDSKIGYQPVER